MKNKVSVLCATYNRPELIKDNIESFLLQDYENKELVIVNDGGQDVSNIIDSYGRKEIRYFNKDNGGIGSALKMAVEKASGEFICICSDDDTLVGTRSLSAMVSRFDDNVDFILCSVLTERIGAGFKGINVPYEVSYNRILGEDYINTLGIMWRSAVHKKIGNFDDTLKCNEDWDWKIRLLKNFNGIACPDILCAKYRLHGHNKSRFNVSSGLRNETKDYIMHKVRGVRILIAIGYGIGNIINATPLIGTLREQYPNSVIDVLCRYTDVLKDWEPVNNVLKIGNIPLGWDKIYNYIYTCSPGGVNVHKEGFESENMRQFDGSKMALKHEVLLNLDMFSEQTITASTTMIPVKPVKFPEGRLIGISAGFGGLDYWAVKNWGYEKYALLIRLLKSKYTDATFLVLGTGKDKGILDYIDEDYVINCVDKYLIQESAFLISKCDFMVCNDTGLAHVSGAVATKTYTIFGATSWVKNKPYRNSVLIYTGLKCQPCQFNIDMWINGSGTKCKNWECMKKLTPLDVFEIINKGDTK